MKTGTKFWLSVGVEAMFFIVMLVIIAFTDKFNAGLFGIWTGAAVAVAGQYTVGNVVASGQVTRTSTEGADAAAQIEAEGKGK